MADGLMDCGRDWRTFADLASHTRRAKHDLDLTVDATGQ